MLQQIKTRRRRKPQTIEEATVQAFTSLVDSKVKAKEVMTDHAQNQSRLFNDRQAGALGLPMMSRREDKKGSKLARAAAYIMAGSAIPFIGPPLVDFLWPEDTTPAVKPVDSDKPSVSIKV